MIELVNPVNRDMYEDKKDGGTDSGTSANHNSKFVCRIGTVHRNCTKHCSRRTGIQQNACMLNAQISVGRTKESSFRESLSKLQRLQK